MPLPCVLNFTEAACCHCRLLVSPGAATRQVEVNSARLSSRWVPLKLPSLTPPTPLAPVYPDWLSDNLVKGWPSTRYETNETRRSSAVPSRQRRLIHRQQNVLDTILAESLQRTKANRRRTLQRRLVT